MLHSSDVPLVLESIENKMKNVTEFFYHDSMQIKAKEVYEEAFQKHRNIIDIKENERMSILEALDEKCLSKYPETFIKIIYSDFASNLLSTFSTRYLLDKSDAFLIMIEYLKFVTLWKLYGDNFSPSKWVDEFWHHHMSYDTQMYRDFCVNVFGNMVEHKEHDPGNLNDDEREEIFRNDSKFRDKYELAFGYFPPDCIWPKSPSTFVDYNSFNILNLNLIYFNFISFWMIMIILFINIFMW